MTNPTAAAKHGNPWEPALANAGRILAAGTGPLLACVALAGGIPALAWLAGLAGVAGGAVLFLSPISME